MNIIFDIDDTITDETGFLLKYAPGYLKRHYGIEAQVKNPNGYNLSEVFGMYEVFRRDSSLSEKDIEEQCHKAVNGFWNSYFLRYMFYPIREDAIKVIAALSRKNCRISFVTLRGRKTHDNETKLQCLARKRIVPLLTAMQLKINHISYDKLIMAETTEEKIEIAMKLKADYVFDDSIDVLTGLIGHTKPICIETPHNIDIELKEGIIRLPLKMDAIMNIIQGIDFESKKKQKKKVKNLKRCQLLYTESFYRLARAFGKNKVMKTYKPIILGSENIPDEGKVCVFVGNHRNIKDPLITIALLKKPVHFAALKRMFEYNDNIFGPVERKLGTVLTTLFVKSIGALPIARPDDEDYISTNLQTFKYIDDYLKFASSIMIYPEGTLNRNPDKDGNILPVKSLYSFKIAENGKALLCPVAIVWIPEKVMTENRVIISFLEPIHTAGMRAKEIANKWQYMVDNAIDSMDVMVKEMKAINAVYDGITEGIGKK